MANLFRRLVRNRSDAGTPADEDARSEAPVPKTAPRPEPAAEARDEAATPDAPAPKPKAKEGGKGPRKTLDEVSSIGPGEPS
jgi:hypothetical protein